MDAFLPPQHYAEILIAKHVIVMKNDFIISERDSSNKQ